MNRKSALLIIPAFNFSEEEFLNIKNRLIKFGVHIFITSDSNTVCKGSKGLKVKADVSLYNVHASNFDAVIFIGGSGVKRYWDSEPYQKIARSFHESDKTVSAICSAPVILARAGLLKDVPATCYQDDKAEIEKAGAEYRDHPVVIHGNLITGQNASAALNFASAVYHSITNQNF